MDYDVVKEIQKKKVQMELQQISVEIQRDFTSFKSSSYLHELRNMTEVAILFLEQSIARLPPKSSGSCSLLNSS